MLVPTPNALIGSNTLLTAFLLFSRPKDAKGFITHLNLAFKDSRGIPNRTSVTQSSGDEWAGERESDKGKRSAATVDYKCQSPSICSCQDCAVYIVRLVLSLPDLVTRSFGLAG